MHYLTQNCFEYESNPFLTLDGQKIRSKIQELIKEHIHMKKINRRLKKVFLGYYK